MYHVGDDEGKSLHFIIRMRSDQESLQCLGSFGPQLFESVDVDPVGPNLYSFWRTPGKLSGDRAEMCVWKFRNDWKVR